MSHPHQAFLDELKIAIDKFVPLTPESVVSEAKAVYERLAAEPETDVAEIHAALVDIGRKEYPYRKAYHDLCDTDEEKRLRELVLPRLDEPVKKVLEEAFSYNILLDDFVRSEMFEDKLDGDQRYQVTNAILLSEEQLENQCDDRAHERQQQFETLVAKRKEEVKQLQDNIDLLKRLMQQYPLHADEIAAVVSRLEEGWSVTNKDPSKEEIEKEIEYWQTVTAEDVE